MQNTVKILFIQLLIDVLLVLLKPVIALLLLFQLAAEPESLATEPVPLFLQFGYSVLPKHTDEGLVLAAAVFVALCLDPNHECHQFLLVAIEVYHVLAIN